MGFKKSWDATDVVSQIGSLARECSSPYNDGFIGWGCKQDLYRIKFILDEIIENASTYSGEQEWLEERAKEKTWKIISK